jgi:hypothetical protein
MRPHHRDEPFEPYRRRDSGAQEQEGEEATGAGSLDSGAAAALAAPAPPPLSEDSPA